MSKAITHNLKHEVVFRAHRSYGEVALFVSLRSGAHYFTIEGGLVGLH